MTPPSIKLRAMTPILRTWDIAGTIRLDTDVLGFECEAHELASGWAHLSCGHISLMLSAPNEHQSDAAPSFTGSLYFRVNGVDGLWSRLKDRARVCYPIETFDYGMREFAIYDNNGYLLQFGESVATE